MSLDNPVLWVLVLIIVVISWVMGRRRRRLDRERDTRVAQARSVFVGRLRGTEYSPDRFPQPSFGYFHEVDRWTPPFHWAFEFQRGGHRVLVFAIRSREGVNKHAPDGVRHETTVEIPVPVTPQLWLGGKNDWVWAPGRPEEPHLVASTPADEAGMHVLCADEDFARRFVTRELVQTLRMHGGPRTPPAIMVEHGVVRTKAYHGPTLHEEAILRAADLLIAAVQNAGRDAWPPPPLA